MSQKSLTELNAASKADFVAALANVVEYSPWIAEQLAARRPFAGINQLLGALKAAIESAAPEVQLALIRAHPDLANKTQRAAGLTAESNAEQNSAGLDRLSEAEYAAFERVNNAYRSRFGFPYIVCVRRHTKDSVLRDFETRLPNDPTTETRRAIEEICRIAAPGIAIELVELSALGESRVIARAVTNADGRTDSPLIGGRPLPIGRYELRFSVGKYYAERGVPLSDPPFLDEIPLRFSISEPESHYHVPLLVTPWSYSTYRGS